MRHLFEVDIRPGSPKGLAARIAANIGGAYMVRDGQEVIHFERQASTPQEAVEKVVPYLGSLIVRVRHLPTPTHVRAERRVPLLSPTWVGKRSISVMSADDGHAVVEVGHDVLEEVELIDPQRRETEPWVGDDVPWSRPMTSTLRVPLGCKIRIGSHRQIRVMSVDGQSANLVIAAPQHELESCHVADRSTVDHAQS